MRTIYKSLAISNLVACLVSTTTLAQGGLGGREIIFTDSQAAVLRADLTTARPAIIASGSKLIQPFGIAVGPTGDVFVSDTGCLGIIQIRAGTGQQRLLSCGGVLGVPFGIAVERSGMLLVANAQVLLRVNPGTGAQSVVSSGSLFRAPIGVAVAENGAIYVADALGSIIRVDPDNGVQTLVTRGGYLQRPQSLAVRGHDIYVTDVATGDMNFGVGRIIHIDAQSGQQSVLAQGGYLVGPVGITLDPDGQLIVGDPYTINPESADLFDGGIIAINKNTGEQKLLARGAGEFVNPRCVALLRSSEETR